MIVTMVVGVTCALLSRPFEFAFAIMGGTNEDDQIQRELRRLRNNAANQGIVRHARRLSTAVVNQFVAVVAEARNNYSFLQVRRAVDDQVANLRESIIAIGFHHPADLYSGRINIWYYYAMSTSPYSEWFRCR